MKRLLNISFLILFFSFSVNAQQWIQQSSGTSTTLRAVKAVDNNIIWAAGSNGLVLNTTDGGATWNIKTPTQTSYDNFGIAAFNIDTAIIIGTISSGNQAKIWKTTDSGNTWMEKYYSANNFSNNIHFFDSNNGIYLGDPNPLNSAQWNILTTTDGGDNWNRVPPSNYPPSDSACGEYGLVRSYGASGDTVWFSTYYEYCSTKNNRIFRSTDRGYNWTAFNMPYQGYPAGWISFSSSTYGIAISNPYGRVARSTDAGATWEALDTIGISPWAVRSVPGYPNFFLSVGENGSANGKSFYSNNYGNSWNPLSIPTQLPLLDVSFTQENAWSVGNNGTILTLNIESIIPDPTPDTLHVPAQYLSIQSAINTASNGDIVLVADGTFYENINFKGKAITVASHFLMDGDTSHISKTIINGSQPTNPDSGSVVYFISGEDTTSILCGFTITGGTGTYNPVVQEFEGGGIICSHSGAKIIYNKITENEVIYSVWSAGGGIFTDFEEEQYWTVIENNIISNNYAEAGSPAGGGIFIGNNSRIQNNIIENNTCFSSSTQEFIYGGGIGIDGSMYWTHTVYCQNNIIRNNTLRGGFYAGGAGIWMDQGDFYIENNDIYNNHLEQSSSSEQGGGLLITNPDAECYIVGNKFSSNTGDVNSEGGAICIRDAVGTSFIIDGNTFEDNDVDEGGGLFMLNPSNMSITNNLFVRNNADLNGGAINFSVTSAKSVTTGGRFGRGGEQPPRVSTKTMLATPPVLINNIFTENTSMQGGAIYNDVTLVPIILNSIFWENAAPTGKDLYQGGTEDIYVYYSDIDTDSIFGNWLGDGNINENPQFVNAAMGDYHLSDSSLCIGAGIEALQIGGTWYYSPLVDIEGNRRPNPIGSMPDIGAYESPLSISGQNINHVPGDYTNIQEAINAASNNDIVLVADGTYYENINFKGKAIAIASHFLVDGDTSHISNTIINGSQPSHPDSGSVVFFISGEDTNSVLCGFTVTGGTGTLYGVPPVIGKAGGGIVVLGSGASIKNNIIEYNDIIHSTDAWGGGIFARAEDGRNFNVVNNLIRNNSISTPYVDYNCLGGGVYTYSSGNVLIANNKVIENSITAPEAYGGGISPYGGGNCSVVGNFVSGNILNATTGGSGGIDIYYKLILRNNLLVNNSAPNGGGMWIEFSNNNASLSGGRGIITELPGNNNNSQSFFAIDAFLENNTIANNTATGAGGGIRVFGGSIPELMNFIIWGNTASTGSQIYGNADVQYSDVEGGWPGIGNIDMDPLFRDAATDDYHLMSTDCGNSFNSPGLDAGDPTYKDQLLHCDWGLGEEERSDMGAYSISELIVGVEGETQTIPTEYLLYQNYPNPFNPNTKINYQIPQNGFVILKVYDVLGNEIATLVNEEKSAGTYEVEVDASNLSSGIYFYQLQSGNYIETKKMILLK